MARRSAESDRIERRAACRALPSGACGRTYGRHSARVMAEGPRAGAASAGGAYTRI